MTSATGRLRANRPDPESPTESVGAELMDAELDAVGATGLGVGEFDRIEGQQGAGRAIPKK